MFSYTRVNPEPSVLLLVRGHPCSGKTTFARKLIKEHIVVAYLDKDVINEAFSPGDRENDFYVRHVRYQTYEAMDAFAKTNLELGVSVVLDSPFNSLNDSSNRTGCKGRYVDIAEGTGSVLKVVQCRTDYDTLRRRLIERGDPRDRSKIESEEAWEKYKESIKAFETLDGLDVRTVDTNMEITSSQMEDVVLWLLSRQ